VNKIYASTTRYDDPEPYVITIGLAAGMRVDETAAHLGGIEFYRYDPRREYAIEQHYPANPILQTLRRQSTDWAQKNAEVVLFDNANGRAWLDAGEPADQPGTQWWAFETHAQEVIERVCNVDWAAWRSPAMAENVVGHERWGTA